MQDRNDRLLRFRLHGTFAHFNQPISNQVRNTYSIIPRTQLLGLIGSIAGLQGYKNSMTMPEFYSRLRESKVYIKTNSKTEAMFIVNYNSLNSFLNNRVDSGSPNVIVSEQVLFKPDFEIGIVMNTKNELHNTIIENIEANRSVFSIYLGKNEFPANLDFISLDEFEQNSRKEILCGTIFPFDEIRQSSTAAMKLERIPIGFNDRFKFIYRLMAVPFKEEPIKVSHPDIFINCGEHSYYVF